MAGLKAPGRALSQLLEVMRLTTPDGREIPLDELPTAKALRSGETVLADEVVIHLPNGRAITTLVNARPLYREDGEAVSVVATIQDITPLEEVKRQRTEFLGLVSHELRTPLTAIKGSASSILGAAYPPDPTETRQFLRIIDEQADHMRYLINDLVDMTQIESGTLSVTPEPASLEDLVEQARVAFLGQGVANSIAVDMAPGLPRVMADRKRLSQVLNNLLANASERSPESSVIMVSVSPQDAYVAVSVEDDGRDVPSDRLLNLFNQFSRTDGYHMGMTPGRDGLGLAICKGIVEATRGPHIRRERRPGTRRPIHLHGPRGRRDCLQRRNGLELMERVRKTSDAPVICVSGHGSSQNMDRAFELGAADYIVQALHTNGPGGEKQGRCPRRPCTTSPPIFRLPRPSNLVSLISTRVPVRR